MGCGLSSKTNNLNSKISRGVTMKSFNFDNLNLKSLKIMDNHITPVITVFSASKNQLNSIPINFFKHLEKVTKVDFSFNNFTEINEIIFEKICLVALDFSHNFITTLSIKIFNLSNLKELNLASNFLGSFNFEVNLFEKLKQLERLDISKNSIHVFPSNVLKCPKLEVLKISENEITQIPDLFWDTTSLKNLDISHNKLTSVSIPLLKSSKVFILNLKGNLIDKLAFMKMDGYANFEQRRKEGKDQGFKHNLDISFGICGLE